MTSTRMIGSENQFKHRQMAIATAEESTAAADVPLLSWAAMAAASHTVADFLGAYCGFHGLRRDRTEPQCPEDDTAHGMSSRCEEQTYWKHNPPVGFGNSVIYKQDLASVHHILMFVEGALYAADSANEARECEKRVAIMETLRTVLRENGLLSASVEAQLQEGEQFWALERVICSKLTMRTLNVQHRDTVLDAIRMKSFDYRVLNHVLYAQRAGSPEKGLMQFLEKAELLAEIADDLYDYEADVEANTFNVYRCFLAMYGSENGPKQLVSVISDIERTMAQLKDALDHSDDNKSGYSAQECATNPREEDIGNPVEQRDGESLVIIDSSRVHQESGVAKIDVSQALDAFFDRGREAARDSGGPVGASGFGNWTFPTPIAEQNSHDGL